MLNQIKLEGRLKSIDYIKTIERIDDKESFVYEKKTCFLLATKKGIKKIEFYGDILPDSIGNRVTFKQTVSSGEYGRTINQILTDKELERTYEGILVNKTLIGELFKGEAPFVYPHHS